MKRIIGVVLSICFILSFSSCVTVKKEKKENLKGDLRVVTYGIYEQYLKDAGKMFKDQHPEVNITVDTINYNNIDNEIDNVFRNNSTDIVTLPYYRVQYYGKKYKDKIKSLSKTFGGYSKDFNADRVSSIFVDGEEVAIPLDSLPIAMMYRNQDLYALGVNKEDIVTWEDFLNIGMRLKEKGKKLFPISMHERSSIYGLLINQLGIDYLTKNEEPTLSSDKSIKALEFIKQLIDNDLVYEVKTEEEGIQLFKEGKTSFLLTMPTFLNYFKDIKEEQKEDYKFMKLPAFEPGGNNSVITSGNNLMVFSNKNSDLGEKFISFATMNKECLLNGLNNYTIMPSYMPIYTSVAFDKTLPQFGSEHVYSTFEEVIKYSYTRGVIPNFKVVDEYMNNNIKEIIKSHNIKADIVRFENEFKDILYRANEKNNK